MYLFDQISVDTIENMDVSGPEGLKSVFSDLMNEIRMATHASDLAVLALNAGNVWHELVSRGVEFK